MIQFFKNRIPGRHQIVPYFGMIVFLVFSWALYRLFYKLPSWIDLLQGKDIFLISCYTLAFDLIESLIILVFSLLVCLIVPPNWFAKKFKAQAGITFLLVTVIRYIALQGIQIDMVNYLIVAAILLINILIIRLDKVGKAIDSFVDRFSIFSYIYPPFGFLGLLIVGFRIIL